VLAPRIVRFSARDLARFSDASFDRNPLHLSEDYARKTAYGDHHHAMDGHV
jgi:acyl dehydratase